VTPSAALSRTTLSRNEWRVLALLVFSALLNYVDRANLSVGATDIQRELHLSNYSLGLLGSAFFWTYAAFQLCAIAGWLVDRFNVCWVYALGFLLWSGATAVTGLANTFEILFTLRLLLGIGESIAYPSYSRILANNYPEHHRGFANALIDAGTKGGPAVGTLLGGFLMAAYGWRPFFLALGFGSLLWLVPWLLWMPRGSGVAAKRPSLQQGAPTTLALLRHRAVWFTAAGLFCSNYFWYFLITWLPAYLEKERHFDKAKMAVFGSLSFLAVAVTSIVSGWCSDRWIERGASPNKVRKTFAGLGLILSTVILPVAVVQNDGLAMCLLVMACLCFGCYTSNVFAITQTLAGPRSAGKWTSLQNGVANLAGVAAPWITGELLQRTGEFYLAFVVAAGVVLAAAFCFLFGIGPIQPVRFQFDPDQAHHGAQHPI
jgi:ACS family D-galactonate transporter-like MFS transporter